ERTELDLDRAAWAAQRDAEQQRLVRERETQEAVLRRAELEIESRKSSLGGELESQRVEHERRLVEERTKFEEERARTRLQLKPERTVFENRVRFQQESLLEWRDELETGRQDFRKDVQQVRLQTERSETALRLRKEQLDRCRALIDERERSLQREQEL